MNTLNSLSNKSGAKQALQPALDRPALGLPHASPRSPAAPCTRSRCMNTLNSLSNKSGAKQKFLKSWRLQHIPGFTYRERQAEPTPAGHTQALWPHEYK
jgi:hypothetical protein